MARLYTAHRKYLPIAHCLFPIASCSNCLLMTELKATK